MSNIQNPSTGYGLNQPLNSLAYPPIQALRNPTNKDKAAYGTIWCNTEAGTTFILSSIGTGPNNYVWSEINGADTFTSLTVSPGPINLTGTTSINFSGDASTFIGNISASSGDTIVEGNDINIDAFSAITIGLVEATSLTIGNSSATISAIGTTQINATGNDTTTIGFDGNVIIGGGSGTGAVNIGNTTGGTDITGPLTVTTIGNIILTGTNEVDINTFGTGPVSIGNTTGHTAITGQLGVASGNVTLITAGTTFTLPGPVNIHSGSGAPASGLAVNVGDLYINTTASTTTTRLYIATGAGSWTFFTSNA